MPTGTMEKPGIYVEIFIRESLEKVWELTQNSDLHHRTVQRRVVTAHEGSYPGLPVAYKRTERRK